MTDLRQTSAMFNKYFQDRRIRRYLINAGLINRHGDILPPTPDQIARARRITQQQAADDRLSESEGSRHRVNFSPKRSGDEKNKNSKQTRRNAQRNASSTRRAPSAVTRKTSPHRARSAYQRSQDLGRQSARAKSPVKDRCRVTMVYYGPATNIEYNNSWYQPKGDEITVSQQHCGGENRTVFRGHVKPSETFAFDSLRHAGYPFALALYVNGLVKSRISVCCEYKHKRNVPLDGKSGLFGIYDVQKAKPCLSCQYEQQRKLREKIDTSLTSHRATRPKSVGYHLTSEKHASPRRKNRTAGSTRNLKAPRHLSPDVSRTPSPRPNKNHHKPSSKARRSSSSSDVRDKRPSTAPARRKPAHNKGDDSDSTMTPTHDGNHYSSNFDRSKNRGQHDRSSTPDTFSADQSKGGHSPQATRKTVSPEANERPRQTQIPAERKPRTRVAKQLPRSVDVDSDKSSETTTRKNNTLSYGKISPPNLQLNSTSSESEESTRPLKKDDKRGGDVKKTVPVPQRKVQSSDNDLNHHASTKASKTIDHSKKSPPPVSKKHDFFGDDESDRSLKLGSPKDVTRSDVRQRDFFDDDDDRYSPTKTSKTIGHLKKPKSSEDEESDQPLKPTSRKGDVGKPSPLLRRKSDSSDETADRFTSGKPNKAANQLKKRESSDDEESDRPLKGASGKHDSHSNARKPYSSDTDTSNDRYPSVKGSKSSNHAKESSIIPPKQHLFSDEEENRSSSTASVKRRPVPAPKKYDSDDDEENGAFVPRNTSHGRPGISDHSEEESEHSTPRRTPEKKNVLDSSKKSPSIRSRKTSSSSSSLSDHEPRRVPNEDNFEDKFFASAIRGNDNETQRPTSSAPRRTTQSNENRTTANLFEQLFGDTEPPIDENSKAHTSQQKVKKADADVKRENDANAAYASGSWSTDSSSGRDDRR